MRRSSVSNRQSLLPLRVQDSNRMGLTTPQNKDRHGFGKLSMTKPHSGASERKTSFFGKRASAGTGRTSQYGAFGGNDKIKDPRPLHDKSFIQQCIRQLCEFLNENGYSQTITVKSLQGPSTKDFLKIFAFIYSFICPNYEIPDSKFEEEIPRLFKELGYPFALSKSSMYTVGAPHTWPQIVAALIWLIDCVKLSCVLHVDDNVFEEPAGEQSENGVDFNQVFLEYTTRCYDQFMEGRDTFDEIDSDVCSRLKDAYSVEESQLESMQAESRRLMEEIERLEKEKENEPDRLASMRKLKASLQADIQKYQNYLTEIESHSTLLSQRVASISEELEAAELECEAIKQENLRLKNILDNQKYSVADIERIKYEENELQQTISKLTKDLDEDKQHLWSEELKYAKIRESVETQLTEFHKLARKVRLIPSTAENANGHDFQIHCNLDSEQGSLAQCRNKINVPLVEILSQSEGQITSAANKKMGVEDMIEQLNTLIAEKRNDVKVQKDEAQKLDEYYQQRVEEADEDEKKWTSEIESLEKHRQLLESGVNKSMDEAVKELQKVQQELQLVEHQTEEEMRQVGSKLVRVVNAVANHVAVIEKHLEERRLKVEREFEEFRKEDLVADLRELLSRYKKKVQVLKESGD
ncbi:kinetochore protein NDC80 homolog [Spea bombifrons]|uniref:kinetochore protein NDC80 homolog n=1 Tax=Spea bombifrons TaxID=233779 RepID=UPI0023492EAE|nr:kinetochore protein NDC80 homolog [Spea bombifrons]